MRWRLPARGAYSAGFQGAASRRRRKRGEGKGWWWKGMREEIGKWRGWERKGKDEKELKRKEEKCTVAQWKFLQKYTFEIGLGAWSYRCDEYSVSWVLLYPVVFLFSSVSYSCRWTACDMWLCSKRVFSAKRMLFEGLDEEKVMFSEVCVISSEDNFENINSIGMKFENRLPVTKKTSWVVS